MSPELPGAAVSQTFLVFHISRRRTGQALLRASCHWEVSAAFLTGRTRLRAWGRSRATAIASHPGCSASPQLTPVGAGRSHLAQEVLPPGQSFILPLQRALPCAARTPGWRSGSTSLGGEHLHHLEFFCIRNLSLLFYIIFPYTILSTFCRLEMFYNKKV